MDETLGVAPSTLNGVLSLLRQFFENKLFLLNRNLILDAINVPLQETLPRSCSFEWKEIFFNFRNEHLTKLPIS